MSPSRLWRSDNRCICASLSNARSAASDKGVRSIWMSAFGKSSRLLCICSDVIAAQCVNVVIGLFPTWRSKTIDEVVHRLRFWL